MTISTEQLTCHFVDICTPDYLQDSHNRENELLILCPIYKGMRDIDIVEELHQDYLATSSTSFPNFDEQLVYDAIANMIADYYYDSSPTGYEFRFSNFVDRLYRDFTEEDLEEHSIYCYLSY